MRYRGHIYLLADDSRIIVRPSGTEPTTKCYYEVVGGIPAGESFGDARRASQQKLERRVEQHLAVIAGLGVTQVASGTDLLQQFRIGEWQVRPDLNVIARGGDEIHLEPRVMDLLVYFAQRPGEVLSADELLGAVWPKDYASDGALLTAVSALRKALGDRPRRRAFIETIPKRGYRLIAPSSAPRAAIAVLPLNNVKATDDDASSAIALTDALVKALCNVRTLRISAQPSVMLLQRSGLQPAQIASKLRSDFIVRGDVEQRDGRLRLSVHLHHVSNESALWSQEFSFGISHVNRVMREAAMAISVRVLQRSEPVLPTTAKSPHPDAWIAYARGRFHWYRFSPEHFDRALEYFEKAVSIDPTFAAAEAGIADVWGAYGYWGMRPAYSVRDKVAAAIRRASACDADNTEALMLAGAYHFYFDRDWAAAEIALRRAIDWGPSNAHARMQYALFLATLRRKEAAEQIDEALRVDPLNPAVLLVKVMWLAHEGDHVGAEHAIDELLEIDPSHRPAWEIRADRSWADDPVRALEAERHLWVDDAEMTSALEAQSATEARSAVDRAASMLAERASGLYVQPRQIARLLLNAGRTEDALDVLETAEADGDLMQIDFLCLSPATAPLRGTPRFQALLAKLNLPG